MTAGTRPPGRPRRTDIECEWPSLAQLTIELMEARGSVRLADFARKANYSIAAVSGATDGKRIPTLQILQGYARAADAFGNGGEKLLLDRWTALRDAAVLEKASSEPESAAGATSVVAQAIGPVKVSPAIEVNAPEPAVLSHTETAKAWIAKRREVSVPEQPADPDDDKVSPRLRSLLSQAVEAEYVANRANVAVHVDPVLGGLALGSTTRDIKMLLRDRLNRAGISFRDLEANLARAGVQISKSTLERKFVDEEPLSASLLSAILASSGVSRAEVNVWLYHRARIEIAEVVHHDHDVDASPSGGIIAKLTTEKASHWVQLGMVCATTLVMVLQIVLAR